MTPYGAAVGISTARDLASHEEKWLFDLLLAQVLREKFDDDGDLHANSKAPEGDRIKFLTSPSAVRVVKSRGDAEPSIDWIHRKRPAGQ